MDVMSNTRVPPPIPCRRPGPWIPRGRVSDIRGCAAGTLWPRILTALTLTG